MIQIAHVLSSLSSNESLLMLGLFQGNIRMVLLLDSPLGLSCTIESERLRYQPEMRKPVQLPCEHFLGV